jgi:nitrite reductase (NO-forming)
MLETDPIAKEMLTKYKIPMPNQNASDQEIKGYLAYFKWGDEHVRPEGTRQPQLAPNAARGPEESPSAQPPGMVHNGARNIYPVHGLMRSR